MTNFALSIINQWKDRQSIVILILLGNACNVGIFIAFVLFLEKIKPKLIKIDILKVIIRCIRISIGLILVNLVPLIYYKVVLGNPFKLHVVTDYGNGDSWIYGLGRPVFGILIIGIGFIMDAHVIIKYICLNACIIEICFSCISAIQIDNYQYQIKHNSAPKYYSHFQYQLYKYRDVISIQLCFFLIFLINYLSIKNGFIKNKVSFMSIEGGTLDRTFVMRNYLNIYNINNDANDDDKE
jgi:hypothetical protein